MTEYTQQGTPTPCLAWGLSWAFAFIFRPTRSSSNSGWTSASPRSVRPEYRHAESATRVFITLQGGCVGWWWDMMNDREEAGRGNVGEFHVYFLPVGKSIFWPRVWAIGPELWEKKQDAVQELVAREHKHTHSNDTSCLSYEISTNTARCSILSRKETQTKVYPRQHVQ